MLVGIASAEVEDEIKPSHVTRRAKFKAIDAEHDRSLSSGLSDEIDSWLGFEWVHDA